MNDKTETKTIKQRLDEAMAPYKEVFDELTKSVLFFECNENELNANREMLVWNLHDNDLFTSLKSVIDPIQKNKIFRKILLDINVLIRQGHNLSKGQQFSIVPKGKDFIVVAKATAVHKLINEHYTVVRQEVVLVGEKFECLDGKNIRHEIDLDKRQKAIIVKDDQQNVSLNVVACAYRILIEKSTKVEIIETMWAHEIYKARQSSSSKSWNDYPIKMIFNSMARRMVKERILGDELSDVEETTASTTQTASTVDKPKDKANNMYDILTK